MSSPNIDFRFEDGTTPTTEQLEAFFDSIDAYFNSTKLDEQNFLPGSISGTQISNLALDQETITKIGANLALAGDGLQDEHFSVASITAAKINADLTALVRSGSSYTVASAADLATSIDFNDMEIREFISNSDTIDSDLDSRKTIVYNNFSLAFTTPATISDTDLIQFKETGRPLRINVVITRLNASGSINIKRNGTTVYSKVAITLIASPISFWFDAWYDSTTTATADWGIEIVANSLGTNGPASLQGIMSVMELGL